MKSHLVLILNTIGIILTMVYILWDIASRYGRALGNSSGMPRSYIFRNTVFTMVIFGLTISLILSHAGIKNEWVWASMVPIILLHLTESIMFLSKSQ